MTIENKRFFRNQDILATTMDGEVVMMSVDDGTYYSLSSGVGAMVWELLETPKSIGELVAGIQQEFEVSTKECESDVRDLLKSLQKQKLVDQEA
ncbi:hypothetical protein GCM10008927_25640 [Amylibacter ulvae]|uniref:PqqD family protein n=1 Tax=Paramylibacter ulvae TaxID=1651968 RepID=A0ABQ3D5G8_9RHOB|nr:PqqD family peptide modification chaperone [Amylibacter ulvae]GHA58853.1 hypothetical protein GCM10008927_25640 [Amylibacter ulvae]